MTYHGANLLPEGLELGEMKIGGTAGYDDLEPCFVIAFTGDHVGPRQITSQGWEFNGIPSSVAFIVAGIESINVLLNIINDDGSGDKILNVFTIPKLAVKSLIPIDAPRRNNLLVGNITCNF